MNLLLYIHIDESFFFYDSLVRKVWIKKDERPVVRITRSHQENQSCLVLLAWGRKTTIV